MSISVRDGKFDVLVVGGPRVSEWPTVGARAISKICAEVGLTVGVLGSKDLMPMGVIPLPGTGGLVLAQDQQGRVHRLQARAVVRIRQSAQMPDPFPGWHTEGMLPLQAAREILSVGKLKWDPATVILGTGNPALRFGSSLLERGYPLVACVESRGPWGEKTISGWEVERRRFEMLGGRIIHADPVQLSQKGPLLWEIRLRDTVGVRVIDVARVVSAGPFGPDAGFGGIREFPTGSFLFELEQTALKTESEEVEGWNLERERGTYLGAKIARSLISDLGEHRDHIEETYRFARARMKRGRQHWEEPFVLQFQGKWLTQETSKKIRSFEGTPQKLHLLKEVASAECLERIACRECEKACPESAIKIQRGSLVPRTFLIEDKCTACGICVQACPSSAISILKENAEQSVSSLTLPWPKGEARRLSSPDSEMDWAPGELATLLNRKGETLGSARVVDVRNDSDASRGVSLVRVSVPTHLLWEARGIRPNRAKATKSADFRAFHETPELQKEDRVEIYLNGEKRLVREHAALSMAFFEMGISRSEDMLLCENGSCGLCSVSVDGTKKLACQTWVRQGMAVKLRPGEAGDRSALCPCTGTSSEEVKKRIQSGNLASPEAVLSVTSVGEGKCRGQLCMDSFLRLLAQSGIDTTQWIDWRFPWREWVIE